MKTKKMPAPRRAGTLDLSKLTRAECEAIAFRRLEELRIGNPQRFRKMLRLLAKLANESIARTKK